MSTCPVCEDELASVDVAHFVVCRSCGVFLLHHGAGLRWARLGEVPEVVARLVRDVLVDVRNARAARGFTSPEVCPGCTSPFFRTGLLPRERVACPSCFGVFVPDAPGTLRRLEHLGSYEKYACEVLRQRSNP